MFGNGPDRNRVGLPQGEEIASFDDYEVAQQAIAKLAQAEFPIKSAMIVGEGLKSIERVTGKLSYARVALSGASTGIWLGMFFGLITILINPVDIQGTLLMAALLVGAGVGALIAVVFYSLNRRRREYTSIMQMVASKYSLQVTPDLANQARSILNIAPPRVQPPLQVQQPDAGQDQAPSASQQQPPATTPQNQQPDAEQAQQPQMPPKSPLD